MNWLNIETSTLDSAEFVGADHQQRSTWLCLLRFCIGQENGGCIADCAKWPESKWLQLVRVSKSDVQQTSDLYRWIGSNLHVWRYPKDKEGEVKAKRKAAKETNKKRWHEPTTGLKPKAVPLKRGLFTPVEPTE